MVGAGVLAGSACVPSAYRLLVDGRVISGSDLDRFWGMSPCLPLFFSFSRPTCVLSAFPSFACYGAIFGEAAPPRALPKTVDNCKTSIEQVETKIVGAILIISLLPMSSTYPGYRQVMSLSITIVVAGCGRHCHPWRWLQFATHRQPCLLLASALSSRHSMMGLNPVTHRIPALLYPTDT